MSYEIPQELEYKEKIMFGLTFKQTAYMFLFAPLIVFVFFKTGMHLYVRLFLSINLAAFGIGFTFLNLDRHIRTWGTWAKTRKLDTPQMLINAVGVNRIENDIVYTKKGRKVAILKVEPTNFSIKPETTKESITLAFQKFLNSLDFPVQIIMNTEKLDLNEHLNKIQDKIKKYEKFEKLLTKYKNHLDKIMSQDNVVNRNFYVVIPETSDLDIQTHICKSKLANVGLKSKRLGSAEITKLLVHYFDGDKQSMSYIPQGIENNPSYLKVGDSYARTIYAHGYPREVEAGFLDKIVSSLGDFDLSLHIDPHSIENMMINVNKELQKQNADLYGSKLKGVLNPSLEIQYEDTKGVLRNLQKGKEKLFNVSMYITCRAKTKKELDLLTKRIEAELNSLLIIPKQAYFRMLQGFQSCAPLALNALQQKRNVPTRSLSAFFPFTSSFLSMDSEGIWFGLNKNNVPIIKDVFKLSNPNGLCLASSGSGKSYLAKLLIARHLLNDTRVMIIDPQGEYKGLVKRFEGQRIDLSRESGSIINPLDLMGNSYPQKRLMLIDLMSIMLGTLSTPQKSFVDKALSEAYDKKEIFLEVPESWTNKPPILSDVIKELSIIEETALNIEKSTIRSLINRLELYTTGVFSFFNQHTNLNFNNKFVCFDIGDLPTQVKPTVMFLVLDYIYAQMKHNLERKLLVIDEAWSLLGRSKDASYIFEIVKTCRKFNLALFLINQEVEGMLTSEAGKSILANSSYTLLMRQKPAVIKNIKDVFYLSDAEREKLLTASVGEGLLLMDDEHSEIRVVASEEEHKIITTNPDELLSQQKYDDNKKTHHEEKRDINISVDKRKLFYLKEGLSQDNLNYLLRHGYQEKFCYDINGGKGKYILKPRRGESVGHLFLTYDIARYLNQVARKVELFETTKPDITFRFKKKDYAIEVETGKAHRTNIDQLKEKVERLNKEYGDAWCFVVTNKDDSSKYSKLAKTFTRQNFIKQSEKWFKKA